MFQTALFAVTAEYRIKYEFPYGNGNYFWQNAWYPPLFNSGQGLIKRIVQIKGIAKKEAMKIPHFGINAVFRLQLSSIKKKMHLMNLLVPLLKSQMNIQYSALQKQ